MRQSNGYVILFTVIMTVVCAGLLAGVAEALKSKIKTQVELDTKSKILQAVMDLPEGGDIQEIYAKNIEGVVVNYKGEEVKEYKGNVVTAETIVPRVEAKKKDKSEKLLPVFKFKSEVHEGQYEAYIVPMYGNGLWDAIWGYVAIKGDFNTIQGAVFDHKAETPGLGARITNNKGNTGNDKAFQERFKGKEIYKENKLVSVSVLKGEGNTIEEGDVQSIDGLSGATMTTAGVNAMLLEYFGLYDAYFKEENKKSNSGSNVASKTVKRGLEVKVSDL